MNFKSVFQAISSALQSNTITLPPVPATLVQNRTGLPIPKGILIDLDLLEQDQNRTIARQSISMAPPLIPAASMQHNSVPTPGFLPDHAHAYAYAQDQGFAIAQQSISMAPPPIPAASMQHNPMPLPPIAQYTSKEALFEAIQAWAKPYGYAFSIGRSIKQGGSGHIKVVYICDRRERPSIASRERVYNIISYNIGCSFSVIASKLSLYQG